MDHHHVSESPTQSHSRISKPSPFSIYSISLTLTTSATSPPSILPSLSLTIKSAINCPFPGEWAQSECADSTREIRIRRNGYRFSGEGISPIAWAKSWALRPTCLSMIFEAEYITALTRANRWKGTGSCILQGRERVHTTCSGRPTPSVPDDEAHRIHTQLPESSSGIPLGIATGDPTVFPACADELGRTG